MEVDRDVATPTHLSTLRGRPTDRGDDRIGKRMDMNPHHQLNSHEFAWV